MLSKDASHKAEMPKTKRKSYPSRESETVHAIASTPAAATENKNQTMKRHAMV